MKTDKIFLDKQRLTGDQTADQLIDALFKRNRQRELYAPLQLSVNEITNGDKSNVVTAFLNSGKNEPRWYEPERVVKGQNVFETYAAEIMTLLGVMALPYCYAGSPGNKALYFSDKMRQFPGKRLLDTADFIISVSTPGSFLSDGFGRIHINKTRLTHSIARHYVKKANWNMRWGLPINQEDMAGTNLAFSYLILEGLNKSGFILSMKEKEDFLFLWRYIGYHLGINEQLLPASYKEAHALTEIIKRRNFRRTIEGVDLTRELLDYYRSMIPADKANFIESQVRYFLGNEVAGYVGLEPRFMEDKITGFVNTFREVKNFLFIHKSSYGTMMEAHRRLKGTLSRIGETYHGKTPAMRS